MSTRWADPGPGGLVGQAFQSTQWRTRYGKHDVYIRIEWIAKTGRFFWRLEDGAGGMIETSWNDAPQGYRAFTPCLAEAREARTVYLIDVGALAARESR